MGYIDRDIFGMYKSQSGADEDIGPALMGADTLIGTDVYNLEDEHLGEIEEIVLNMRTGGVVYAVLTFGGFLGFREKLFAVPWKALLVDGRAQRLLLRVTREELKNAPGFARDNWPDMADPQWSREIDAFYEVNENATLH